MTIVTTSNAVKTQISPASKAIIREMMEKQKKVNEKINSIMQQLLEVDVNDPAAIEALKEQVREVI